MNLTAAEIKTAVAEGVAEGVAAGVAKQRDIDEEKHSRHHAFLDYWIEREERKRQRWDRIRTTVIGGAILMAISGVGTFLYKIGQWALEGYRRTHG